MLDCILLCVQRALCIVLHVTRTMYIACIVLCILVSRFTSHVSCFISLCRALYPCIARFISSYRVLYRPSCIRSLYRVLYHRILYILVSCFISLYRADIIVLCLYHRIVPFVIVSCFVSFYRALFRCIVLCIIASCSECTQQEE
jgi:hypothetical protein